jgi:hypothetical protein
MLMLMGLHWDFVNMGMNLRFLRNAEISLIYEGVLASEDGLCSVK